MPKGSVDVDSYRRDFNRRHVTNDPLAEPYTAPVCSNMACSTYGAVRDPLLVAVLLRSSELLRQLGAVDVRVQLRH